MTRVVLDSKLMYAAGRDAGNRSMRANNRTSWNNDDYLAAVAEFDRLAKIKAKELDQ